MSEENFSGLIPVDPGSLTTEYAPMDDSIPYEVMVKEFVLSQTNDRNGNPFLKAQLQVVQPDEWRGRLIFDNYIPTPGVVSPDMDYGTRRQVMDRGVQFARFLRCFKVALGEGGFDPSSAVGKMNMITIKNEEYNGKINARVKDYLF